MTLAGFLFESAHIYFLKIILRRNKVYVYLLAKEKHIKINNVTIPLLRQVISNNALHEFTLVNTNNKIRGKSSNCNHGQTWKMILHFGRGLR